MQNCVAAVNNIKKLLPLATVYLSSSKCIYENLAFEESVFRHHDLEKNGDALLLWSNTPSVVIGRHQNPWLEANLKYCSENSIQVARRQSGGGTVYHDLGNLNVSMLSSQNRQCRKKNLSLISDCLNQRLGVSCIVPNERDDLIWEPDGSKFSGTAARIAHGKAYHHFTILVDACVDVLQSALRSTFKGMIETNATKSTPAKSVGFLAEKVPGISVEKVNESVVQAYLKQFDEYQIVEWGGIEPSTEENQTDQHPDLRENLELMKSEEWIYGKTPKFEIRIFDPKIDEYFNIVVDRDRITESLHPEFQVGELFHEMLLKSSFF